MDALLIQDPFGLLMAMVAGSRGGGVVRGSIIGLKILTSKNGLSDQLPQKPLAQMSRRAPLPADVDLR